MEFSPGQNDPINDFDEEMSIKRDLGVEIAHFLGKDSGFEDVDFFEVKKAVEKVVDDLAMFLDSKDIRPGEEKAERYVNYFFPVIEHLRRSSTYKDLYESLKEIETGDLAVHHLKTRKKRLREKFFSGAFAKSVFPDDSPQYKKFHEAFVLMAKLSIK